MNLTYKRSSLNLFFSIFLLLLFSLIYSAKVQTNADDNIVLIENERKRLSNLLSGSSFNSFTIQAGENDNAEIKFGTDNNFFSFVLQGKKNDFFLLHQLKPLMTINKDNELMLFSKTLTANKGLSLTGELKYRGVSQWRLVYEEDFSGDTLPGWSKSEITECGGVRMLGGYCKFAGGEVQKTYDNLPLHSNVRIEATYHFIDAWDTEAGFMRINNGKDGAMEYVWTERNSAFLGSNGINICGGRWAEGKFSSKIDVTIPHKSKSIKIGFGSTLEQDACDESFGVSGIRIYVK
jgi:hypothetical protein